MVARVDISTTVNAGNGAVGVAMDTLVSGQVISAFMFDDAGQWKIIIQQRNPDLTTFNFPVQISLGSSQPGNPPVVKALSDGGFAVMYTIGSTLFLDRYDSSFFQVGGHPVFVESNPSSSFKPIDITEVSSRSVMLGYVRDDGATSRYVVNTVNEFGDAFGSFPETGFAVHIVNSSIVLATAPHPVGDETFFAVTYQIGGGKRSEIIKINSTNATSIIIQKDAEALDFMRLPNGDWLVVVNEEENSFFSKTSIEIYSSDFSTLKSQEAFTTGQEFDQIELLPLDNGTIAVVMADNGNSTARLRDSWAVLDGETGDIIRDSVLVKSFDLGAKMDTPFTLVALQDGGFAIVREAVNAVSGTFSSDKTVVTFLNQGTIYADRATLASASEFDAGAQNDVIEGSSEGDVILGGSGNDTLLGHGGDDTLVLDDPLLQFEFNNFEVADGGAGNDLIQNASGAATLIGGTGRDAIFGGFDSQLIQGGIGFDNLRGGDGDDTVLGGNNNDRVKGDNGNDLVRGGNGRDIAQGGDGTDTVRGGDGNDRVSGGRGDDLVKGDGGNDVVMGGLGNDTLKGGQGNDVFLFNGDGDTQFGGFGTIQEEDLILDFTRGEDKIKLRNITDVSTFADLEIEQVSAIATVTAGTREITVMLSSGTLNASDFDIA